MKPDNKIPAYQLVLMVIGSRLMQAYTYLPVVTVPGANHDAWITSLVSIFYSVILCIPILFIMNKFRNIEFSETLNIILGSVFGKILAVLFSLFFMFLSTTWIILSMVFINSHIFDEVPSWAILFLLAIPAVYIAVSGLTSIGRIATIVVPFAALTVIAFFLLGINKMDFSELQPILADSNFIDLNWGAFLIATRLSDVLIIFVLYYYLMDTKKINKVFTYSLTIFSVLFILMIISVITVLGFNFAKISWNPYFAFTRQVQAFDFIQRVELINTLAWFISTVLNIAILNFIVAYLLSKVFGTKSHKMFVIPILSACGIISLIPFMNKSSTINKIKSADVFPYVSIIFIFVIPLILLIIYFIRKAKINELIAQKE